MEHSINGTQKKQKDEPDQKKDRTPVWIVSALIAIFLVWTLYQHFTRETTDSPPELRTTDVDAVSTRPPLDPTEEQLLFEMEQLRPLIGRARTNYPIESIRLEFESLMNHIDNGSIKLVMSTYDIPGDGFASAYRLEDEQMHIAFSIRMLMDKFEQYADDPETLEDIIVAVFLHEGYHLIQQSQTFAEQQAMTPNRMMERESECWWYIVEEVYQVMWDYGRLQGLMSHDLALFATRVYATADGDPNHPLWVKFSWEMIGDPDPQLQ